MMNKQIITFVHILSLFLKIRISPKEKPKIRSAGKLQYLLLHIQSA
jgi:hypothetical protein